MFSSAVLRVDLDCEVSIKCHSTLLQLYDQYGYTIDRRSKVLIMLH